MAKIDCDFSYGNCVKGRLFRPKNDKSTDGLAFIILSQFKSMYLFKKNKQKNTHYNCNYLNLKLLILFLDHCVHSKPANIWHPTLQELWEYMKFRSKFSHLMSVSLLYSFFKSELDFSTCIYAWGPCHFNIWMFYKEIREN